MKKYIKDMPKLAKEYHFEKNVGIDFDKLTHGSHKKVWWKCSKGHEWRSLVKSRYHGSDCSYCMGKKVCEDNCLATTHPKLAREWSNKNKLKPTEITYGVNKRYKWSCLICKGEWLASPNNRSKGKGCPYCANKKVNKNNCLTNSNPELVKEWNYNKNDLKPTEVVAGSNKRAWWECFECKQEWVASVADRNRGIGCPYCANKKVCKNNCLSTTHPKLAKEWNYDKNEIKPDEVVAGSDIKVWWKCKKKHIWKSAVKNRSQGKGCPYCSNKLVCEENCLATTHPELAKEWASKNKIKPNHIISGCNKKFWWRCSKCKGEWESSPNTRITTGSGCPVCNESKGEKLVSQILDQLQIRYKREYRIKQISPYMRFDFALFEKYARKPYAIIEFHGRQHYQVVNFSKNKQKNIDSFNSLIKNDKIKKQYCLDNNIKYLEIPYKQKKNLEQIIREFIK